MASEIPIGGPVLDIEENQTERMCRGQRLCRCAHTKWQGQYFASQSRAAVQELLDEEVNKIYTNVASIFKGLLKRLTSVSISMVEGNLPTPDCFL